MSDKAKVARVTLPREVAEAIEDLRKEHYLSLEDSSYEDGYYSGVIDAVEETLNLLGIKISGVNAPVPGVNADA